MVTLLPGFENPVQDAQQTFRALLEALARPGTPYATARLTPPPNLPVSAAAALLTLLDLETRLWLQPGQWDDTVDWVQFHTGCAIVDAPNQADFAVVHSLTTAPDLTAFRWGTAAYPEDSTSLFLLTSVELPPQVMTWRGPGIQDSTLVKLSLPLTFWQQWQSMTTHYPQGVDAWICTQDKVLGLPRTTQVTLLPSPHHDE